MNALLLVAAGGALGSVARYALSSVALHHTVEWRFPLGTFLVNVLGCLAVGVLEIKLQRRRSSVVGVPRRLGNDRQECHRACGRAESGDLGPLRFSVSLLAIGRCGGPGTRRSSTKRT